MADNAIMNAGSGGKTLRTLQDASGLDWPVSICAYPTSIIDGANVLVPVDLTHGLPVQIQTGGSIPVTDNSGSLTVDAPVGTPVFVRLSDGTNPIATLNVVLSGVSNLSQLNGNTIAMGTGVRGTGVQRVTIATDDVVTVQPGNTPNTTPWLTTDTPATSGGLTPYKLTSAASTNATSVKASAGQIYGIMAFNVNAAVRYLKLYNKASAPAVGTDTPVLTLAIPGNTAGAGFVVNFDKGIAFSLGIAFALTTEATDAGATGVAASELTVNLLYK